MDALANHVLVGWSENSIFGRPNQFNGEKIHIFYIS